MQQIKKLMITIITYSIQIIILLLILVGLSSTSSCYRALGDVFDRDEACITNVGHY